MSTAGVVTLVYAVLLLVGGVMGYVSAQSMPSLISGVVSALLAGVAGVLLLQGARAGLWLGLVVAAALILFAGKSVLIDHAKFMPRGLILVLSLVELVVLLWAMTRRG